MTAALHLGRSWVGHPIEDACPCPQEPCGLVTMERAVPECEHHPWGRTKTMRQIHQAKDCPGSPTT